MGNLLKETPYSEITATLEILDKLGVERQHLKRIRTEPELSKRVTELLLHDQLEPLDSAVNRRLIYRVTVDYGRTLDKMIAAGRYDWVNDDINAKNFSIQGEGQKETDIVLLHFNKDIESDEATTLMDKEGYRPATLEDGRYPFLQTLLFSPSTFRAAS